MIESDSFKNCRHKTVFSRGFRVCILCGHAEKAVYYTEHYSNYNVDYKGAHLEKVVPDQMALMRVIQAFNNIHKLEVPTTTRDGWGFRPSAFVKELAFCIRKGIENATSLRFNLVAYGALLIIWKWTPMQQVLIHIRDEYWWDLRCAKHIRNNLLRILPALSELRKRYNPIKYILPPQTAAKVSDITYKLMTKNNISEQIYWQVAHYMHGGRDLQKTFAKMNNIDFIVNTYNASFQKIIQVFKSKNII